MTAQEEAISDRTYFDRSHHCPVTKVFPGEFRVAKPGAGLATILGSCVAACIRHPRTRRGGMNHFLLARAIRREEAGSTRYGQFAMEALLRAVLREGGRADELEVKVFGGGALGCAARIGEANAAFVLEWLAQAGLPVAAQDLGGLRARKVLYFPDSGRVLMQRLGSGLIGQGRSR